VSGRAPDTLSRADDWRARAACKDTDPNTFFPDGSGPRFHAQIQAAKDICWACPVRPACAQWAIETGEPDGVWGGLDPDDRKGHRRSRGQHARQNALAPCGSLAAYRRHLRRQEPIDEACREANRLAQQEKSDAVTRPIPACGTDSAYQRHVRRHEPVDDACREARRAYDRERLRGKRTEVAA